MSPTQVAALPDVPALPEVFNFADHLLRANEGRPEKIAFVDDLGRLTSRNWSSACAVWPPAFGRWA